MPSEHHRSFPTAESEDQSESAVVGTHVVDDLLALVQQENSKDFAIMAVPDQMADGFLCQQRYRPKALWI